MPSLSSSPISRAGRPQSMQDWEKLVRQPALLARSLANLQQDAPHHTPQLWQAHLYRLAHQAITHGQSESLRLLLQAGAPQDHPIAGGPGPQAKLLDRRHPNLLLEAAKYGELGMLQDLIEAGGAVDRVSPEGRTAMHYAAMGFHLNMLRVLINHGAQADPQDAQGQTPAECLAFPTHYSPEQGEQTRAWLSSMALAQQLDHEPVRPSRRPRM